jgi:hypothetical protein
VRHDLERIAELQILQMRIAVCQSSASDPLGLDAWSHASAILRLPCNADASPSRSLCSTGHLLCSAIAS